MVTRDDTAKSSETPRTKWAWLIARGLALTPALAFLGLTLTSLDDWARDRVELRAIVHEVVPEDALPSEAMVGLLRFMELEVGFERGDAHYLSPALSFLRPTARQIIEGTGGDCAYRARAYIVLLHLAGVDATKLAVYDSGGRPVHAIVKVHTERGDYLVDVLFGIVYQDEYGYPIPPASLANEAVLRASIEREVMNGAVRAARYPVAEYPLEDLRSINWEKTAMTRATYRALVTLLGDDRVNHLPRPYLSEEPALMVAAGSAAGALASTILFTSLWRCEHRSHSRGGREA